MAFLCQNSYPLKAKYINELRSSVAVTSFNNTLFQKYDQPSLKNYRLEVFRVGVLRLSMLATGMI